MLGRIVSGYYDYNPANVDLKVTWVVRTEDRKRLFREDPPFKPYFFVDFSNAYLVKTIFGDRAQIDRECGIILSAGKELIKVETNNPKDVAEMRDALSEAIEVYEADIPFVRRVAFDIGLKNCVSIHSANVDWSIVGWKPVEEKPPNPKILFFDFETTRSGTLISFAAKDEGDEYFFAGKESEVVEKFLKLIEDKDWLVAWNCYDFDQKMLYRAASRHKLTKEWRNWRFVDQMRFYKFIMTIQPRVEKPPDYRLDTIARRELGRGKKEIEAMPWELPLDKLKEYNLEDVRLLFDLEQKTKIIELFKELTDLCGIFIDELYPSTFVDALVLPEGRKRHLVFRCNKFGREVDTGNGAEYEGGYVREPVPGLHKGVTGLDFYNHYNRIIQSFNISPETKVPASTDTIAAFHNHYTTLFQGLFPHVLSELEKQRVKYKVVGDDVRATAYKVLILIFYGVLGYKKSRYYEEPMAEDITLLGQMLVKAAMAEAEAMGVKILAGDTDSLFINTTDSATIGELLARIDERIDTLLVLRGVPKPWRKIDLEIQDKWDKVVFGEKKKRWAGIREGKKVIAGFEVNRSDWPGMSRESLKEAIDLVLAEEPEELIRRYVEEVREELFRNPPLPKLVLTVGTKENLDQYKNQNLIQVKVSKMLGETPGVANRISYMIVNVESNKPVPQPVIEGMPLPSISNAALTYYWNKRLLPPLSRFLRCVGIDISDLRIKPERLKRKKKETEEGGESDEIQCDADRNSCIEAIGTPEGGTSS